MQKTQSTFTVVFDAPYWVGIYERVIDGDLEVCKITFGKEPKDYEVYAYLFEHWYTLSFSPQVQATTHTSRKVNPKRMQRLVKKQMQEKGITTKAQQALKAQQEARIQEKKHTKKVQKQEQKQQQFKLRQQKKKAKHRGH